MVLHARLRLMTAVLVALSVQIGAEVSYASQTSDSMQFTLGRLFRASAPPPCKVGDAPTKMLGAGGKYAVLDTNLRLPNGWQPPNLIKVSGGHQLQRDAASAWRRMALAAADAGVKLHIASGYRSATHQQTLFNRNVKQHGRAHALKYLARPGHSEHQLGLTVDIGLSQGALLRAEPRAGTASTKSQRAANWMRAHAASFGWVRSYPKGMQSKTCYGDEPWHWRYVGVEEARAFMASNLTLREYLWLKR